MTRWAVAQAGLLEPEFRQPAQQKNRKGPEGSSKDTSGCFWSTGQSLKNTRIVWSHHHPGTQINNNLDDKQEPRPHVYVPVSVFVFLRNIDDIPSSIASLSPNYTRNTATTASPAIATMGSPSGALRPRASSNFMGISATGFPPSMTPQEKHLFSDRVNSATTRLSSTMAASETDTGYMFVVYFHKNTAADALSLLQAADIRVRGHPIQFSWH
ncbi:hypothetical protein CGCF413_v015279 [Colletotrichum fructicola]|nr:hypothetical protein CGCF413_v015279 [Colletotrichum fructicola]